MTQYLALSNFLYLSKNTFIFVQKIVIFAQNKLTFSNEKVIDTFLKKHLIFSNEKYFSSFSQNSNYFCKRSASPQMCLTETLNAPTILPCVSKFVNDVFDWVLKTHLLI